MTEVSLYQIKPKDLETRPPFSDLFPVNQVAVETLAESMRADGFLKVYPIAVWNGVVVDGHTRLAAAIKANLIEVECAHLAFESEDEALTFAIEAQVNRRNLSDAELFRCIETLDVRRTRAEGQPREVGRFQPIAPDGAHGAARTSSATAELLGISPRKVERTRTVLDHAADEVKQAVLAGEKTINAAYNETQAERTPRPKPKPKSKHDSRDERIADLEVEVAELKERLAEMADLLQGAQADNESMARILDADDLRAAYQMEVHRASELARVTQSRNNGLMDENAELTRRLKSALRKIQLLTKAGAPPSTEEEEIITTFEEVM